VSEGIGLILFALVVGLGSAIIVLAIWRLIFCFFPIEEPTKWALFFTAGSTLVLLLANILQGVDDWLVLIVQSATNLLAVGICWYLWIVRAKREGRYYG